MTKRQMLAVLGVLLALGLVAALRRSPSPVQHPETPTATPATAPVAPPPPRDPVLPIDHPGPAGVAWGTSAADAKRLLATKLHLTWEGLESDEHAWLQHYTGEFAGLVVEQVEATFAYDKARPQDRPLMVFVVILTARDERPASRRWLDIVEKMRGAYGEPSEFSAPPEDIGATVTDRAKQSEHFKNSLSALGGLLSGSRFSQLDREIAQGTWQPSARWRFRNHVMVGATVLVAQPDKHGHRDLKPVWLFVHEDLSKHFFDDGHRTREF